MMVDTRVLPHYAAGDLDVDFTIHGEGETLPTDTVWPDHSHPVHELLWTDVGVTRVTTGAQRGHRLWTTSTTLGLWIPAGVGHTASAPAGTRYRAAYLSLTAGAAVGDQPVSVEITPLLRGLLDHIETPGLAADHRASAERVILDLLRPAQHELVVHVPDEPLIAAIALAVMDDPADARSLDDWATAVGVSPRTVTRAFQRETGLDFTRWAARARAHHAIGLLVRGHDVSDVAARTGYATVSAFGAAFRRTTGATPGAFQP